MIFKLLHPGSPSHGPLEDALKDYQKRFGHYGRFEEKFLKASRQRDVDKALLEEASLIKAQLSPRDGVVLLDRSGEQKTSPQLADFIQKEMNKGQQSLVFVIGSAHGLHASLKAEFPKALSFGKLTLPHDLARVVLMEQLYRAMTILRNEPYHK